MPAAIRKSVDPSAGHCFPPRPADTGSPNVFVNVSRGGDAAVRDAGTDHYPTHCCGDPCHDGVASEGSPDVFVNNDPFHRKGDGISCGDVANNGSPNVFVNSGTGSAFMINNTVPYAQFNGTDQALPDEDGPSRNSTNDPHQFYVTLNDTEEDVAAGHTPPPSDFGTTEIPDPIEEDQTPPPVTPPPIQDCSSIDSLPSGFRWQDLCVGSGPGSPPSCLPNELRPFYYSWAASFSLSANFSLADVTTNPVVSTYLLNENAGLSQKQILINLCYLAKTILEPMRARYGSFQINSGFRNKSGTSQHNKGQAVDIQFPGYTGQQYWDLAQDIRDNINFDQFILEYGGYNPWLHLSVNPAGHRHKLTTQTSPGVYQSGLIRMA